MKGNEYLAAYKGWVYACVNAIAEEVATLDLKLQRLNSSGWVDIDNHLALTTLHDVNPFMSSSDLLLHTQAFLELEGNAFWYLPRGKATNKPAEIWLLDPTRTLVVKSASNFSAVMSIEMKLVKMSLFLFLRLFTLNDLIREIDIEV